MADASNLTTSRAALTTQLITRLGNLGYTYAPLTETFNRYLARAATGLTSTSYSNLTTSQADLLAVLATYFEGSAVSSNQFGAGALLARSVNMAPSVDISFLTPGTLDSRITFSRASAATYFDNTGAMQTAATDVARWDYEPAPTLTLRGLLIEEARTNALTNSDTRNPGSGTTSSSDISRLKSEATLWNHVWPAGAVNGPILSTNNAVVASTSYTASCWVYIPAAYDTAVDGLPTLYMDNGGLGTGGTQTIRTADTTKRNQWQRVVSTVNFGTSPGATFNALFKRTGATTGGSSWYCTCPQIETGAFATSYIPTTSSAVTRARDVATMPLATSAGAEITLQSEFALQGLGTTTNQFSVQMDDGGNVNRLALIRIGSTTELRSANGAGSQITVGTLAVSGTVVKLATTWSPTVYKTTTAGVAPTSAAGGSPAAMTIMRFGDSQPGTDTLNGWIRRIRYWNRTLSDADMRTITT